ncbi:MAG: MBL fold metallo-hydrolase [Rhodobacteraceae bacterium]|nr:MBL fold metallo-hydrolase [Paracoccaceae bacterium]
MKITWYGHSSFGVVSQDNVRIVTDPYDPETSGYKPFPDKADIVIKSSSHDDFHDNDHLVPKKSGAHVYDAIDIALSGGCTISHGIKIQSILSMEHLNHPRGHAEQNAMYRFTVDDITVGHMGDMGNDFSEEQMDFFRGVNILFSHAGGFPVIDLEELKRIVCTVQPNLVIPMHFRTLCFKPCNMHFITEFLRLFSEPDIEFACRSSVSIVKEQLPQKTRALILSYL